MEDKIEKIIELKAPVSRVWRAVADHEEFGQWFRVKLDGPFVVGEVTRGRITAPGYEHMAWESRVETMDAERLFAFTWPVLDESEADGAGIPHIRVEFRLEPTENGTRLTITESGFAAVPDPTRLEVMRQNEEGWEAQVANITAHVDS